MKWESAFGSRSDMFGVLGLIAFEFLMIVTWIFIGDFVLGWIVRFILLGLAFLVHVVAVFVFVVRGFLGFRLKRWLVFIPVLFLIVTAFPLLFLNQKAVTIRFKTFQGSFAEVARRVANQEFPSDSQSDAFAEVSLPVQFFYLGGVQSERVQLMGTDENILVFFWNSGFLFGRCGYLYSSKNKLPKVIYTGAQEIQFGFDSIAHNWFYGCLQYD